jgi:chromosome partitioning protein
MSDTSSIIAVANQKGGVGKTTTAVNLGASLAAEGHTVLLVDFDPQGNASSGVGVEMNRGVPGVYELLAGSASLGDVVLRTELPHLSVIPASRDLAALPMELSHAEEAQYRLRTALAPIASEFAFVIIDCPPSLDLLTINGLTAARSVLVPVQCEYYALEGLSKLNDTIRLVQAELNPDLSIEGIVLTMYDPRTNLAQQVVHEVKQFFREKVYETMIPRNIRLSEAPSHGKPCLLYDLASRGTQSYLALARELLARRSSLNGQASASA